jgi:hypothetical protein
MHQRRKSKPNTSGSEEGGTPQWLTMAKMWHDNGLWDKNCIKFDQSVRILHMHHYLQAMEL